MYFKLISILNLKQLPYTHICDILVLNIEEKKNFIINKVLIASLFESYFSFFSLNMPYNLRFTQVFFKKANLYYFFLHYINNKLKNMEKDYLIK